MAVSFDDGWLRLIDAQVDIDMDLRSDLETIEDDVRWVQFRSGIDQAFHTRLGFPVDDRLHDVVPEHGSDLECGESLSRKPGQLREQPDYH
ncbi:MAG: hypothetical protein AAGF11_43700 [Myxococcota bacterium]